MREETSREVGAGTLALIMPEDDCTGQLFPELQLFSPEKQTRPPLRFKEEGSAFQRKGHVGILARRLSGFRPMVRDDEDLGSCSRREKDSCERRLWSQNCVSVWGIRNWEQSKWLYSLSLWQLGGALSKQGYQENEFESFASFMLTITLW